MSFTPEFSLDYAKCQRALKYFISSSFLTLGPNLESDRLSPGMTAYLLESQDIAALQNKPPDLLPFNFCVGKIELYPFQIRLAAK